VYVCMCVCFDSGLMFCVCLRVHVCVYVCVLMVG